MFGVVTIASSTMRWSSKITKRSLSHQYHPPLLHLPVNRGAIPQLRSSTVYSCKTRRLQQTVSGRLLRYCSQFEQDSVLGACDAVHNPVCMECADEQCLQTPHAFSSMSKPPDHRAKYHRSVIACCLAHVATFKLLPGLLMYPQYLPWEQPLRHPLSQPISPIPPPSLSTSCFSLPAS